MQSVLITGGSGFLGSKIAKHFQMNGWNVILALRKSQSADRLSSVINKSNVRVVETINGHFKEGSDIHADIVIHAATCYGRNGESWEQISEANIVLPLDILYNVKKIGFKMFINFDTFFNEDIKFDGNEAIYVKTKKIFSKIIASAANNLPAKFIDLKLEQMYGPDDNEKKFIPWIINALVSNIDRVQLTGGEQKRDWIYVDDVVLLVEFIVNKYQQLNQYEKIEVGTGETHSIREVIEYLKEITNSKSILCFGELAYRSGEIFESKANVNDAYNLGWRPMINWHNGLQKTILYYKTKI